MQGMGFDYQPSWEGSCGAYSFKHAMNLLGQPITASEAKKSVKHSIFRGVDEIKIQSAIRSQGFKFTEYLTDSHRDFKEFMDEKLDHGSPIILWVNFSYPDEDDTGHWIVCGGRYNDKYIIIDSAPLEDETNVTSLYGWDDLMCRCIYRIDNTDQMIFYGMAINPNGNESAVTKLPKVVKELMKNEDLSDYWGYYLSDLIDIFDFRPKDSKNWISAEEFFTNNKNSLIGTIDYWSNYESFHKNEITTELKNYETVAKAFDLGCRKEELPNTLSNFSVCLLQTLIEFYEYG